MSRREELIPLSDRPRWEEALSGIDHAFGHTWASCHAMHATTGHDTYLYHFRDGDTRFVCPIAERTFYDATDIVTPYGFSGFAGSGDVSRVLRSWSRFARERDYVAGFIALNPLLAGDRFRDCEGISYGPELFFLDLSQDEDRLLASMTYRRRRKLARWRQEGCPVLTERALLAPFFHERFVPFMKSRGATPAYHLARETLARLTDDPRAILLGRGSSERIEAAALFCHTESIGEYMFTVSEGDGRGHTDALIWAGALELKRRNVNWMSLGGGVTRGDGVEAVKRGYGGLARRMPVLRQIYDSARFGDLCRAAGADPDDREGYFPPYRQGARDVH